MMQLDSFLESDEFDDLSDYDDETLESANTAFFLCEEERDYDAAEPFLKFAAKNRYSYSMASYGLLLIRNNRCEEEVQHGCDLLLVAAIRQNENACAYFETVDKKVVAKIIALLQKVKINNLSLWIRGKTINNENDNLKVQKAKTLLYNWVTSKRTD